MEIWAKAPALHPAAGPAPDSLPLNKPHDCGKVPCRCLWSGVGIELTQGGLNMWACVNLLAGCKYIISHNQPAVWCTRCGGSCRWSGTSPVQIYTVGGRWRRDKDTKFSILGESQTGWSSDQFSGLLVVKILFSSMLDITLRGSFAQWSMMSASQPALIGQVANSEGNTNC